MAQALRFLALSLVLLLTACVTPPEGPPLAGPLPPQPPGTARLIFYRTLQYYDTTAMTTVYLNGKAVGISMVGSVFYRDVAPGQYDISVFSYGSYPNQFKSVVVGPGNVFYSRIDTLPKPPCPSGRILGADCPPDTFIVTVVDPVTGYQQVQGLRLLAGLRSPAG
jgi:hypothetical protein